MSSAGSTRLAAGRGRHRACKFVQLARIPQRVQTGDEAPELRRGCRCRTRRQGALLCSGEQRFELLLHFGQECFCRPVCPDSGERPITWCRRAVEQHGATGNRQCERHRTECEECGCRLGARRRCLWVEGRPVGIREPACCALEVIFGPRIASVCRCKPACAPQLPAKAGGVIDAGGASVGHHLTASHEPRACEQRQPRQREDAQRKHWRPTAPAPKCGKAHVRPQRRGEPRARAHDWRSRRGDAGRRRRARPGPARRMSVRRTRSC